MNSLLKKGLCKGLGALAESHADKQEECAAQLTGTLRLTRKMQAKRAGDVLCSTEFAVRAKSPPRRSQRRVINSATNLQGWSRNRGACLKRVGITAPACRGADRPHRICAGCRSPMARVWESYHHHSGKSRLRHVDRWCNGLK